MTHRTSWAHERILERESFDGGWIKILYRRSRIPSRRQPCAQRERFSKWSTYQCFAHSCAAQFHLARRCERHAQFVSSQPGTLYGDVYPANGDSSNSENHLKVFSRCPYIRNTVA